jgi:hypothetical protein
LSSSRPLVLRVALLASASVLSLGVVAGCVQSPVANPAPLALTDAESTSQAYTPDNVPVVVPSLGSAPDVLTPSGDETTPMTAPMDPGGVPAMQAPAATKAAGTAAPTQAATQAAAQPQATEAATTQAPTVAPTVAPTTAQATAAKTTTAGTQALVGPGAVELRCTAASQGRTKAVLKWANPGFNASVTVNGQTTVLTNTKATSLTAYAPETKSGHGICTGSVGDSPAANSY